MFGFKSNLDEHRKFDFRLVASTVMSESGEVASLSLCKCAWCGRSGEMNDNTSTQNEGFTEHLVFCVICSDLMFWENSPGTDIDRGLRFAAAVHAAARLMLG
jgi:hypothetical protein